MAVNIDKFITDEQQFGGLYKLSDNLFRDKQRKEQQGLKDDAQRNAMSKFLVDYADPKERLSGSPYDPIVTKGFSDIMQEGMKLIGENKGLTTDMLLMALAPKVGKLSQYAETAKIVKQKVDKSLEGITDASGYDKMKLAQKARQSAFYDDKGELKDISTIDPSVDYVAETVKNNPQEVTTNKGIDEYLKGIDKNVRTSEIISINSRGGKQRKKVKITAPAGFVPDTDEAGVSTGKFVPEYDIAADEGNPVIHEFDDGKGGVVKAPVRMIKDSEFHRILGNSPSTGDWLRGQVMQHLNENTDGSTVDINSPQAKNIAKAILYDELKSRNVGSMEEVVENKATPIKIFAPRQESQSAKDTEQAIDETYKALDQTESDAEGNMVVTPYMGGVTYAVNPKGKRLVQGELVYNHKNKTMSFDAPDPNNDDGLIRKTVPIETFMTMAKSNNSNPDIKYLRAYKTYQRNEGERKAQQETLPPKKGWISTQIDKIKKVVSQQKPTATKKGKYD